MKLNWTDLETPNEIARGRAACFREYLTRPLDIDRFLKPVDAAATPRPESQPRAPA